MKGTEEDVELPLFPLTGTLLLPGTFLPLNVFERRYRNLVADALEGERLIGMVQPRAPSSDNFGPRPGAPSRPDLYDFGGFGFIKEWRREPDGRYLIVLEGLGRFEITRELSLHRGYRRARVRILEDRRGEHDDGTFRDDLLNAVSSFGRRHGIEVDDDLVEALPGWRLVNVVAAAFPFEPAERQLLLETNGAALRGRILLQLLDMGRESAGVEGRRDRSRGRRDDPGLVN